MEMHFSEITELLNYLLLLLLSPIVEKVHCQAKKRPKINLEIFKFFLFFYKIFFPPTEETLCLHPTHLLTNYS